MVTTVVPGYDATRSNIGSLPHGKVACGYTTGSPDIVWTAQDWANHPGAVRIDQDHRAADGTADVLDVENGAATVAECADWSRSALENWHTSVRPGQRLPAIYLNQFNVTPVVNNLIAGGIVAGVGLWIANWNYTYEQAAAIVAHSGGPFPIIGIQYNNAGAVDDDAFSVRWLSTISGMPPPVQPKPPVLKPPVPEPPVLPPPPPKPLPPGPTNQWEFPAPAGLRTFNVARNGYRLAWNAVTGPSGQKPAGYHVITRDAKGNVVNQRVATQLGTAEYGPEGHGLPPGKYTTRVWADGGPVAPKGSEVSVTLAG